MEIKIKNDGLQKLLKKLSFKGASCYIVGGYVRDYLLGVKSKDIDIEIYNMSLEDIVKETKGLKNEKFGIVHLKEFGVDLAIPRTEKKIGNCYDDFLIESNTNLDLKKATTRRDFSINSIMYNIDTGELIDNFEGVKDLKSRKIRHISEKFIEDPLRVLRAIRFSTNLNFDIEEETYDLCKKMAPGLKYVSKNKKSSEIDKILSSDQKYLINQKDSLELLSIYIGDFDINAFEKICKNDFVFKKELLKFIIFKDSSKKEEFLVTKKEKLKIEIINSSLNEIKTNFRKSFAYDTFLKNKEHLNFFLEVLEVFEIEESNINLFKEIDNIYSNIKWKEVLSNKKIKDVNKYKKDYVLSLVDK